ncbi:unnamed protein product, partial [Discosporangium mesarthrocarpum]
FSPEDVCALESMVNAHRHLRDLGITQLTSPEGTSKVLLKLQRRKDVLEGQVSNP